ncbi:putative DNA-binding domain-containing protein [Methylomonas sp. UP202]|uniref:HvfC family RiPP maturation protein n=1 Tax=Methylomonas sp. UP202 TaxID=3040943 RepID=UPI00247B0F97|nr:putative DNA-binding domain-containing protein [Methylomonas sp. UP202]WGS86008.1 putative DNA-binding domain-containing protein [Methylomonas sp. UP202]
MVVDFSTTQREFAGYIRAPLANRPPADVDSGRMAMYRELFFNNIDSFLASNFPVLKTVLTDQQWREMAEDFYARHPCRTPYFSQIAEEFLDYLQNQRDNPADYPFLLELAHYEWVEMALSIAQEQASIGDADFITDSLNRVVRLSPLAWPLLYQFPVQAISPAFLPEMPGDQPTCLIVYRDIDDDVHFLKTTPLTIRALQILDECGAMPGRACLDKLGEEFPQLDRTSVLEFGARMLTELAEKGIVIPGAG